MLFNNEQFITKLINDVKNNLGRQLQQQEKQVVISFLQKVDPTAFNRKRPEEIIKILTIEIVNKIHQHTCNDESVDIHEMLKTEIGDSSERSNDIVRQITGKANTSVDISALLGNTSLDNIVQRVSSLTTPKTIRILLDTRYRILDNDGTAYYRWNFISRVDLQQGSVNATTEIANITAIRSFSIKLPYVSLLDNNAYNRVTMYISEFSAQSIIGQESRNYHFMYQSKTNNRFVDLEFGDIPESAYYRFRKPIARLDTITITFGSPLQPVIFDTDRLYMNISTYGAITTIVGQQNHNLETGDLVYITDFNTTSPNNDLTTIQSINDSNGVVATYIDDTSFSINIDTSLLKFLGPGIVYIFVASNLVTGVSTSFTTTFKAGDRITFDDPDSLLYYEVTFVFDDNYIWIEPAYQGNYNLNNVDYYKDNTFDVNINVYFGSKRSFIPLEIEYIG